MLKQDKKAVSPIIGYVILVAGIIAVSAMIYPWLKSYTPQEKLECRDGSSIYLKYVNCTKNSEIGIELRIILVNNGLFNLDGFMIYASEEGKELATIDLTNYAGGSEGMILFKDGKEPLEPNQEISYLFEIGDELENIPKIEIIPTRFEIFNNKKRFAVCGKLKISELLNCS